MLSSDLEIAFNRAVQEATKRHHEFVTIEHVFYALLFNKKTSNIIKNCGGSIDILKKDLEKFFKEKLENVSKKGMPQPTVAFQRVIQRAAYYVKNHGQNKIKSYTFLISIFSEQDSFVVYLLKKQDIGRYDILNYISHGKNEKDKEPKFKNYVYEEIDSEEDPHLHINIFTQNLTNKAKDGKIDPLIGRESELERIVQILCRRKKNNPILVGESGVGKTALIEGFVKKIVDNNIPDQLKGSNIFSLDIANLIAGSKFRGDFEFRFKSLLYALKNMQKPILFIDEIHNIVGAGSSNMGGFDISNLLKPVLSSGEIRCIGATTYQEYLHFFQPDSALNRRFQKLDIAEPSKEESLKILSGLKNQYQDFHKVKYNMNILKTAVDLSYKHIRDKFLPDKAIDIIDEAGAILSIKLSKNKNYRKSINISDIMQVISNMTKIPIGKIKFDERKLLKGLNKKLKSAIFGQESAVDSICSVINMSKSGLSNQNRPIANFLFMGPTGVGKTELVKKLSEILDINLVRFDMSEYMEKHSISRLIGAPPGYVGYEQGGILTDVISQNPYSVVLFDEIEKAHLDIQNILLQIMDYGTLTDSNGRVVDFRNVLIFMTTNAGSSIKYSSALGFDKYKEFKSNFEDPAIKDIFSPEFRNRIDEIIKFNHLDMNIVLNIVDKFIKELKNQLKPNNIELKITDKAKIWLANKGYDRDYGARPLKRIIQKNIKKILADKILFGELSKGGNVHIDLDEDNLSFKYSKLRRDG